MASTVAGAINWIGSVLIEEGKYLYGVEKHVQNLQKELRYMLLFLQKVEANSKPLRDNDPLVILTDEMRDLAIRAEDVVSIYRVDVESSVSTTNFLLKVVCLAYHSIPVHALRTEIEDIQAEIKEAMGRSEAFGKHIQNLEHQQGSEVRPSSSRPNPENFLHLDNDFVVGIEDDIANLVKRLTNPEDDFRVLGIIGTGGAGKSTLATQIYRHSKVESWFSHKAFVSISQEWDSIDLLSRIYKQIMQVDGNIPSDKNELLKMLHDVMKDQRCLVVLDDIWYKKAYNDIHPIFPSTEGIKIIITTRIEEVILHADTKGISHVPKLLTKEEMLELFQKIAVDGRKDIARDGRYLRLAEQMLEKMEGLPLAVVTLAGILRTKRHLDEWKRINEACSSNILRENAGLKYGAVMEMLRLSYRDLPSHVKSCFLYLGIVPEDQEFLCQEMAQMWIAEGFITKDLQMGEETLEDVAMGVLDELAQRCILQIIIDEGTQIKKFRMHDLMREFCITTANQYGFLKVVTPTNPNAESHRLSICSREYEPQENQHLRTLVYLNGSQDKIDARKLESIDKQFKVLRVLSIQFAKGASLPKNIGKLVYLTYLSLVDVGITILPESIRNLRNLLYFTFVEYEEVVLPDNLVGNMENLRLLEVEIVSDYPGRIGFSSGRHKELHTLKCPGGEWIRKELQALSSSSRLQNLEISSMIEKAEEMDAVYQVLSHNIRKLSLEVEEGVQFDLGKLGDCPNLWKLFLHGPVANLVSFELLSNLVHLWLTETRIREGVDLLEALGRLSQLKFLYLLADAFVGKKLSCASGDAFPQLQELRLCYLESLEEWEMERGAMKALRDISIDCCWRLKKLPECIRYITTLQKLKATFVSSEFVRRYKGYGRVPDPGVEYDDDRKIIQHIPYVVIRESD